MKLYSNKLYIFINKDYKVLVLFFVDNIQIIYNKSNTKVAKRIIKRIYSIYKLYKINDTK
jgi:hypothetical protein